MNSDLLLCRGISKETGKWVTGYPIIHKLNIPQPVDDEAETEEMQCLVIYDSFSGYGCEPDRKEVIVYPETICRCTGLKDSSGNLIFENDILRVAGMQQEGKTEYGCVFWNEEIAAFMRSSSNLSYESHPLSDTESYCVVGDSISTPDSIKFD